MARAKFGWEEGADMTWFYGAEKIGDIFSTDSDDFYRYGNDAPGFNLEDVNVKIKVRASYRKRDSSIRVMASFTA